ncbi:MAG: Uncharacterised protein [Cellulomonadaceae bacterium TMED98]|nr:MAG: Uncharacterised protein [Cellulomonadaceae bacterium TMED98]
MSQLLSRDDIITGLRGVIRELQRRGYSGRIRVVGGAALALRYFDRGVTTDVDAVDVRDGHNDKVAEAARVVARTHRWVPDWLNFEVTRIDALPVWGIDVEWETLYSKSGVTVEIPSPEALLVMKLKASRRGRDAGDIRKLLAVCEMSDVAELESLYQAFYPGEVLPSRALTMLEKILAEGTPVAPGIVPRPDLRP